MAEQSVTLNPGESKQVSFEATPHEARTYHVSVNGLTGSFVAAEAPPPTPLVPCVYCGATFSTEQELISHMEANHSGSPYLIYAYVYQDEVPSGGSYTVKYKAYIPTLRELPPSPQYPYWLLFIDQNVYRSLVPWAYAARIPVSSGQGVIEGTKTARAKYNPAPYKVYNIPPGTYALASSLVVATSPGDVLDQYWRDVDTGETLTVI